MYFALSDAPADTLLELIKVEQDVLADRLRRMGVSAGSRFTRLNESVMVQPVRVKGPDSEVVLGAGMAGKIVVHLDDDRKIPLAEMKPGESGHIEGMTCGAGLRNALGLLGLLMNDRVSFLRKLPFMEYVTLIETDAKRVRLPEGIAAKLLGEAGGKFTQFCNAQAGKPFVVNEILGGRSARMQTGSYSIKPGKTLILEKVKPALQMQMGKKNTYVISSKEGLRLYLEECQADKIFVRTVKAEWLL